MQHLVDVTPILENLNDAQREAVTAPAEPTLVIAGAGSGKTRVLVHRAAWLIDVEGLSPQSLLAVTFTNKAAAEMRGRIEALLDMPVAHLWIGTFHGLAHRLLRRHWREAGLPQNFQIIDSDDQLRLIKRLLKNLEVDDSRWVPREIQYFINGQKDIGNGRSVDLFDRNRTYGALGYAIKKNLKVQFGIMRQITSNLGKTQMQLSLHQAW